jgi:TorA maturation chaperone TorD
MKESMKQPPSASAICFGLDEELDRSSCAHYLQLLGQEQLAELLSSRMSSDEIAALIDFCSKLLHRHLSKQEYHDLFLREGREHSSSKHAHE